jgi:hypothetical protein
MRGCLTRTLPLAACDDDQAAPAYRRFALILLRIHHGKGSFRGWLIAVPPRDGALLFIIFVAPEVDFAHLQPVHEAMPSFALSHLETIAYTGVTNVSLGLFRVDCSL